MTQSDLNRAVARATGESVSTIAGMGFVPLTSIPVEQDPEDQILDWDDVDSHRRMDVYPYRRPRAAVA